MSDYEIINDTNIPDIKRSVDVRLKKVIGAEGLATMAQEIKQGQYQRTFIAYYLPNMEVGKGAWATTHFNPTLEIKFYKG